MSRDDGKGGWRRVGGGSQLEVDIGSEPYEELASEEG